MVPITEIRTDLRHPLLFEKKNDHEEREDPLPVSRVGLRLCIRRGRRGWGPGVFRSEATLVVEPPPEKGIDPLREVVALLAHQP